MEVEYEYGPWNLFKINNKLFHIPLLYKQPTAHNK
jgi:hypothetical protein